MRLVGAGAAAALGTIGVVHVPPADLSAFLMDTGIEFAPLGAWRRLVREAGGAKEAVRQTA